MHDRTILNSRAAALALVIALTAGFATMPAFAEFGAPVTLTSGLWPNDNHPRIALNSDGRTLVVWGRGGRIELRERTAVNGFGPVQTIDEADQFSESPHVAIDASGNALIIWTWFNKRKNRIYGRARSAEGALGPVRRLSERSEEARSPRMAINANGNAMIVWSSFDGTNHRVYGRAWSTEDEIGPMLTLSEAYPESFDPQVAVDANGNALVVWSQGGLIQARKHSVSGTLGPVRTLSHAGGLAADPRIVINPEGKALVVWERHDGVSWRIQARTRSADGVWGRVQTLSAAGETALAPSVAMNAGGEALVLWHRHGKARWLQARSYSAAGEFGQVQTLSPPGERAFVPQVAIDGAGNAVIAWPGTYDGSVWRIQARTRLATGEFEPVQTLSEQPNLFVPQVAMSSDGAAVAVWDRRIGSVMHVQAAMDDGSEAAAALE